MHFVAQIQKEKEGYTMENSKKMTWYTLAFMAFPQFGDSETF